MKSKVKIVKHPDHKKLDALSKKLKDGASVKVGLPRNSNDYPSGTSVIMVGAVHEFGSPSKRIPQRSFLRSTLNDERNKYKRLFKKLAKKIVNNAISKKDALGLIGLQVQGDVQGRISDGINPELKHREGTPLIDTGHLRQSITYEIDD